MSAAPEPIILEPERRGGRKLTTRDKGPLKKTASGGYSGRRGNGQFRKLRSRPQPCTIDGCGGKVLARGYCRRHYERDRKYGDPNLRGVPGGPKFTPAALDAAGITPRRRNHWVDLGLIEGKRDKRTGRFTWTTDATRQALLIDRLANLGFPLPMASRVARAVVKDGQALVLVAPGVWVQLDDDTAEVSAL